MNHTFRRLTPPFRPEICPDYKALIELDQEPWAKDMRDLLIEANEVVRQAREQGATALPLAVAEWVILVTSLSPEAFSTADALALHRLRWRIELGFKRLKSLIGLKGLPGFDECSARPYVLAHLLIILLLEPANSVALSAVLPGSNS